MLGKLEEELDDRVFEQAWRDLVARHDVLRTSFALEHSAESTQTVHEEVELPFERIDLRGLGPAEREARIEALVEADRARGFDLARAPLLRVTLVRAGERDHRVLWTIHHALVDGRSLALLLEEVFALYEAGRDRRTVELAPPAPFESYVEWLLAQDPSEHADFFRTALAGVEPQRRLVLGGERGGRRESGEVHAVLSVERTTALQELAREQDCTIHTLVQAAWSTVLRRLQGSDTVVFGATRACRYVPVPGIGSMVGLLINTLPARAEIGSETRMPDLLRALRQQSMALRPHEHVPLSAILGWLGFEKGFDLFRTISVAESFVFDSLLRTRGEAWQKRSFELLERSEYPCLGTRLDDRLHIGLLYERPELDACAAEWMVEHLESMLCAMPAHRDRPVLAVADPGPRLDEIAPVSGLAGEAATPRALDEAERRRIVVEWNQTDAPFPEDRLVHDLVAEQAVRTPVALAVASSEGALLYGDLDRRANQIAHLLRREGVGPEIRVAVCMERSRALPIALLAVLRAGGAYVPIDPANPPERIRFLVEDSSAHVLLTQPERVRALAELSLPVLAVDDLGALAADEPREAPVIESLGPRNLAYVIYTSGSTGLPKGVLVEHRSLANLVAFYRRRLDLSPAARTTMIAGVGFDAAVVDLWPYLAVGASIHVPPQEVRADPRALRRWLVEQRIDVTSLPTVLACISHQIPTAAADSTESSRASPSGLLDVLFKYACVALRSE
ncbi:MAG: AMP-binding protein, partial [Deltaproteobacteria bacterium]|nr:AMP-binding protein [Deltaproteobacteria bacterium]